jgi:CIC family chloride channel protein
MSSVRVHSSNVLDRLQLSTTTILILSAIAVGAGTGLGAVFFINLIIKIEEWFYISAASLLGFMGIGLFVIVPVIGGLLSGPVITYFAREAKGHGVPEVMEAIALKGGRIRARVVVAKVVASALAIGTGGSVGREGPIVQVGSALGSAFGQWLHLSEARLRNLVACGAAAGIAATFNAPIAGVIFAMEIILGELHLGDLGNVIISAVTASTVARIFLGDHPAFIIPNYAMKSPWEVLLYAILGILAAFTAIGFVRMLYWFEDRFDNWHFPDAMKPAVGGFLLGALGIIFILVTGKSQTNSINGTMPVMFGTGLNTIEQVLLGELPLILLLALVILKPLATSLTLGSGSSGGVFAPSLFTGAALGGAFGWIVEYISPGSTAGPGAFAIVGMAAVFAGAAHAPFTAILIVFEMTNDYHLMLPLMAAVIVSLIISRQLQSESIYTLKLARRGIHLKQGRVLDIMDTVRVEEVMVVQPVSVPVNMPVVLLSGEFLKTGRHGFPVMDKDGTLYGMVSLEDYRRATNGKLELVKNLEVKDIATRIVVSVFPDETVGVALQRMAPRDLSRLPVVDRNDPKKLLGVVRRNDLVRAYDLGSIRREEARQHALQTEFVNDQQAQFTEVRLASGSSASGKTLAELTLPRAAVIVSIRRGHDLIIPHGDTCLKEGDSLTVLCERHCIHQVMAAFSE